MHDDIMDQGPLRRGSVTVHEKWGKNIILSGDVMLVESYKLLMSVDDNNLRSILYVFNKACYRSVRGNKWIWILKLEMMFQLKNI